MQDSNNISLFNNYSLIYYSANKNKINSVSNDRENEDFFSERLYNTDGIVFHYHESSYDAFNSDRKHIQITNKGIITTY